MKYEVRKTEKKEIRERKDGASTTKIVYKSVLASEDETGDEITIVSAKPLQLGDVFEFEKVAAQGKIGEG